MSLDDEINAIRKEFDYLFKDFGFQIVFIKEFRPAHYSVGLESKKCRIFFYRELGGWNMFVGSHDALYESETKGWVNINALMTFLLGREMDWSELKGKTHLDRITLSLSVKSKYFKPLCNQIIDMFKSTEEIARWKLTFDQYMKEKVQK